VSSYIPPFPLGSAPDLKAFSEYFEKYWDISSSIPIRLNFQLEVSSIVEDRTFLITKSVPNQTKNKNNNKIKITNIIVKPVH